MTTREIKKLCESQRRFFDEGGTLDVGLRREYLRELYREIEENLHEIHAGLRADLGKSEYESYMTETGQVRAELSYMIKHLPKLAGPQRRRTPAAHMFARSRVLPSPYGVTLVMSPWNYPFLLSLDPLIDAVAAGNTVILKTSSYSPGTSAVVKSIVEAVFPSEYAAVVIGGRTENEALLEERFDYIFFTGSKTVGQLVYERAAANMTPVTLELGGKSPCIVDETADVELAARRIAWGKFLNLGQTCVAPDYVLCEETVRDRLVDALRREIKRQYGAEPLSSQTYGRIINEKHFTRICGYIDPDKVVIGGECRSDTRSIEPTVMVNVTTDDAVMREEIFGPVLPILTYRTDEEAIALIKTYDSPLALYIFSRDKRRIDRFTHSIGFGGGCVNDVVVQIASTELPFGGFGASGIGAYHGKAGFDTFTHYKSIVDKKSLELSLRYRPYSNLGKKLMQIWLK